MGKRYHCDFCGKSFQDNPQSRKRHLNGISHQRNRRLHYESVMVQTQIEEAARHGNVSLLRSNLTGEEILEVWLKQHPDVSKSSQEQEGAKTSSTCVSGDEGRAARLSLSSNSPPPEGNDDVIIPPELTPYENVLPPSLLPVGLQYSVFLGTTTQWGGEMRPHPRTLNRD